MGKMKDKIIDIDESNDFGFSFMDDSEIPNENDILDLQNRLKELRKMFLPLLQNLSKNPDKDMIKWPNRKELLDKQILRLNQLTDI
jgi:hypothetical protein